MSTADTKATARLCVEEAIARLAEAYDQIEAARQAIVHVEGPGLDGHYAELGVYARKIERLRIRFASWDQRVGERLDLDSDTRAALANSHTNVNTGDKP